MKFLRIFLLFSFAVLFPASECPAPAFVKLGDFWTEGQKGALIEAEVFNVEIGSLIKIEKTSDLTSGDWVPADAVEQTVEKVPASINFFVSKDAKKEFFRAVIKAPTVAVRDGVLVVSEGTTLDQVLNALNRSGDQQYSIQNPYEGEDIQDPANPSRVLIAAGEYQFTNAEDLNSQIFDTAGGIWAAPPAKDDQGIADRNFPATTVSQLAVDQPHDLPGDTATDDFSKGWGGDEIRIVPRQGTIIPPGQFDKPFENLDNPGNKLEQIELPPNNNIGYVRVEWEFVRDPNVAGVGNLIAANIQPKRVIEVKGDTGFLSAFPPIPGKDQYIAAIVGANGEVLQITTFIDPLVDRSYPPNFGEGQHHRNTAADSGEAFTSIPLANGSVTQDLDNLMVVLYGVKQQFNGDENILTPDVLTGHPETFVRLTQSSGRQMLDLFNKQPSNDELLRILQNQIVDPGGGGVIVDPGGGGVIVDPGGGGVIVDPGGGGVIVDPGGGGIIDPGFGGLGRAQAKAVGISALPVATNLHKSGSNGSKLNITIIGDGFDSSAADQQLFDDYVDDVIMDGLRNEDIHPEILNGINVVKINTFSRDSGVTQVDASGNETTTRRTALDTEYSGQWGRCWMEDGAGFSGMFNATKLLYAPQTDISIIVMNETGFGGCARGSSRFYVTLSSSWAVAAHEFGHNPGGLGDEYGAGVDYTGSEPGSPNLTTNTDRDTLKWRQWVPSWRSLPTTAAQIADITEDVGLFAGGIQSLTRYTNGLYHPSSQGRMNNNTPDHNPVGYAFVKNKMRSYQEATFRKNVTGDFNGDGRTDLVLLDGRQISLYLADNRDVGADDPQRGSPPRGVTAVLDPTWYNTDHIRNASGGWFRSRPSDEYYVGDFDGDGLDDIYVVNLTNWSKEWVIMLKSFGDHFEHVNAYADDLPGWGGMRSGDQFYVADFNGDGRDDLCVYNGTNWAVPYFGMFRSTGTALRYARRYDKNLPGWEMGKKEKFHVGDYNGDGREEFVVCDSNHWSKVHFRIYTSTGSALSLRNRFYGTIDAGAINWPMRRRDKIHALDFNGDGITDISTFNGRDWSHVYLGLWRVDDSGRMSGVRLYDTDGSTAATDVIGWQMARRDKFYVADVNGDGNDDLVAYNKDNWNTEYLGMLRSSDGNKLQGSWQDDWIGSWNLGDSDSFKVADFRGSGGWDDLIVYNEGWLGLLRSYNNRFVQETLYRKWIHNHRYHKWGWW